MHTGEEGEQRRGPESRGLFLRPRKIAIMDEHPKRRSIEQLRAHLARADSELKAAQRLLDPRPADEFEMDLMRAMSNARTSVDDALETIRAQLWD
jgi:hypothetical protein